MELSHLRKKIDALDAKIIALLNERAGITLSIGKEKIKNKKSIYAPDREQDVLRRIKELNKGPISPDAVKAIYREIMSASLALEKPLQIGYMGPQATFSHLASIKRFGSSVTHVACTDVAEVFAKVENSECDYGVVPIENSIEGVVSHTMDMLVDSDLKICSEILFEISHNLMSTGSLKQVKRIYSKAEVFGQCRLWLEANMPRIELVETGSTSQAAQRAQKEDGGAAIASKLAATLYNLNILAEGIEDSAHNVTRFLVVGRHIAMKTKQDKTSIVVSIKDKVGAL